METVNFLSPDKADMSGFSDHPVFWRCVGLSFGPVYRGSLLVSSRSAMHLWIAGQ